MRRARFWIFLLVIGLIGCAVNPVTGKKELSLISESQEVALGKQTDVEIRQQYGVYDDADLNSYVQAVGQSLARHTHRPQLPYQFAVLDTPVVNAFAVPGGYIYVTRGILALMRSEAELAVVLGHELGHVNARHSVRRMSQMMLAQVGLVVGSVLSETFAKAANLAGVGVQLLFLKYSRDDEYQADTLGVEYARKGIYDPGKMIPFFASLEKLGDLSGGRALPGFLSTHPLTKDRIERVKQMLTESDGKLEIKEMPYLTRLDGLIYGDDPRQGYVEDGRFYHPDMAFAFTIPNGWHVVNTPSQVMMSSPDEKAALVLQAEKTAEDLQAYARKKASRIEGSQFVGEDNIKVPGLTSVHQIYRVNQQQGGTINLRLSAIRKADLVYTFTALAGASDFRRFDQEFKRAAQSFGNLTNPAYLRRKPTQIKLLRANGRQTLQEMFSGTGVKKDIWPTLAILNGMELGDRPPQGKTIKAIR
ncbi:MAG: M48 family metalloprotease [Candidatus Aminicenantes bacterium]|nr:M48 family metalloprotease [Candidatus Aminicenantes bacterium]